MLVWLTSHLKEGDVWLMSDGINGHINVLFTGIQTVVSSGLNVVAGLPHTEKHHHDPCHVLF
jgi:hypothetical protein